MNDSIRAENGEVLAYLDPVSWLVGAQVAGASAAWIYVRLRRGLRLIGLGGPNLEPQKFGMESVSSLEAIDLLSLAPTSPRLIIVIEGPRDWPYLASVAKNLADIPDLDIWCVSAGDEPREGLESLGVRIRSVENPSVTAWALILTQMHATVVITTLTDLGGERFPKSKSASYAYIFHSPVSTHVAYPDSAFDSYDMMFCPGERHVAEVEQRDRIVGRTARMLVAAGYPYIDDACLRRAGNAKVDSGRIVLAPSWSSDELFPTTWANAALSLRRAEWIVLFRPHPETMKRSPDLVEALQTQFADDPGFELDFGADIGGAHPDCDAMVSDWSGAAIEFALAGNGPVAFVDTPRKIRNPNWRLISDDSVETDARSRLGPVISIDQTERLPEYFGTPSARSEHFGKLPDDVWMSHKGEAAEKIASHLRSLLVQKQ